MGVKKETRQVAVCSECGHKNHIVSTTDKTVYVNCAKCGALVLALELTLDIQGILEECNKESKT